MLQIDPLVTYCLSHSVPLTWSSSTFATELQKKMYEMASQHGIRSGVTLPIHGVKGEYGILCLVDGNHNADNSSVRSETCDISELTYFRDYIYQTSLKFIQPTISEQPPLLTSSGRRDERLY
jgi:LuxR family quorum-sensing transcriptional regulator LasR